MEHWQTLFTPEKSKDIERVLWDGLSDEVRFRNERVQCVKSRERCRRRRRDDEWLWGFACQNEVERVRGWLGCLFIAEWLWMLCLEKEGSIPILKSYTFACIARIQKQAITEATEMRPFSGAIWFSPLLSKAWTKQKRKGLLRRWRRTHLFCRRNRYRRRRMTIWRSWRRNLREVCFAHSPVTRSSEIQHKGRGVGSEATK